MWCCHPLTTEERNISCRLRQIILLHNYFWNQRGTSLTWCEVTKEKIHPERTNKSSEIVVELCCETAHSKSWQASTFDVVGGMQWRSSGTHRNRKTIFRRTRVQTLESVGLDERVSDYLKGTWGVKWKTEI